MNTHSKLTKSSALALALAALFVASFQTSAAEQSSLLWAEHLKDACKTGGEISQSAIREPRFETDAKRRPLLIWAGHFKEAYTPSLERTEFASVDSLGVSARKTTPAC